MIPNDFLGSKLSLKSDNDCIGGEMAIYYGASHIGYIANITDKVPRKMTLDGIIIGQRDLEGDFILGVEVNTEGKKLLSWRTNTTAFTKRMVKLMNISGKRDLTRFFRGFYRTPDGVYDVADKLLYDYHNGTKKGILMDYHRRISIQAVEYIDKYGDIIRKRSTTPVSHTGGRNVGRSNR